MAVEGWHGGTGRRRQDQDATRVRRKNDFAGGVKTAAREDEAWAKGPNLLSWATWAVSATRAILVRVQRDAPSLAEISRKTN